MPIKGLHGFALALLCLASLPDGIEAGPRLDRKFKRGTSEVGSADSRSNSLVTTTTSGSDIVQIVVEPTAATGLIKPSYNTELDTQGRPSIPPFPAFTVVLGNAGSAIHTTSVATDVGPTTAAAVSATSCTITAPAADYTVPQLVQEPTGDVRIFYPHSDVQASTTTAVAANDTKNLADATNIFGPISTDEPPAMFTRDDNHPVSKQGIVGDNVPVETNKFYANFFLESRDWTVWTMPYMVRWTAGHTLTGDFGFTVSHTEDSQRVYGPDAASVPVEYYINPNNLEDLTMGANGFTADGYTMTTDSPTAFSINVNLGPSDLSQNDITFPLCHGQSMLTGLYNGVTPQLTTGSSFSNLTKVTDFGVTGVTKYRIQMTGGVTWLLYATATETSGFDTPTTGSELALTLENGTRIEGGADFHGIIQLAKFPLNGTSVEETLYDNAAGVYCTGVDLSGSVSDASASYSFKFATGGVGGSITSQKLLMYALPHHVASISNVDPTSLQLLSSTKGKMTAFVGDTWTFTETDLATGLNWAPWSRNNPTGSPGYSSAVLEKIAAAAAVDVAMNFSTKSDLDSMYYSGKELSKDAFVCWVVNDILADSTLATTCLDQLKAAFSRFSSNQQTYPLYYDTVWKGLVSSSAYVTGDTGTDFGNSLYNDHHFHYGYHVHAAAVIGHLDPTWLTDDIKAYVNALIRDYANPSSDDPYFPVSRSFDWFSGHSWAKGLFASADGKDQESGSEDYFATYATKMWGTAIGDDNMVARATIMLAIQERAVNTYFLLAEGNDIHPANFEPNMITGILFENKVDCTTYFGTNIEYIHGIHMIPLSPVSPYIRPTTYVQQEWDKFFADSWETADGGWRGIVKANQAIIDPASSYDYFSQDGFDLTNLDGGASLTWYLAWTAGLQNLGQGTSA